MPRKKTLVAGALNITIHEHHNPKKYMELFKYIYGNRMRAKVWNDYYGIIGWLSDAKPGQEEDALYGVVYRYMEIDPEQPALDIDQLVPLPDGPPVVPDKVKFNLKQIYFYFDASHHRMYFEANQLSALSMHRFLSGLLYSQNIQEKFGPCEVNIEYSKESITRILAMPAITELELFVTRPNPDDLEDVEAELFGEMDDENKKSVWERHKPVTSDGLKPGPRTKAKMRLAKSYGYVWASGRDEEGKTIRESTEAHPLIRRYTYQQEHYSRWQALQAFSSAMYEHIRS